MALVARQGQRHLSKEVAAVGQAREGVGGGEMAQFVFHGLAFSGIA